MRRIGVIAMTVCCASAWPASAAGDSCDRRPGAPRFAATAKLRAVVVCDRMRGTRRVVRRVAAPARIQEVAIAGPRVAWLEGRRFGARRLLVRHLLVPGGPRELDRGFLELLRAAGGVTLSWVSDGAYRFVDLAPPPTRDGCPARPDFRTVEERGGLRVTYSWHGRGHERERFVWRACRIGSSRDPVVLAQPPTAWGNGIVVRLAGAGEGVVAFVFMEYTRYDGCNREHVVALDADTGERVRTGAHDWCAAGAAPRRRSRATVTSAGAVAWVRRGELRAVTATGAVEVLDRGRIDGLRAEGDVLRWTNGGEPREARP